ncbi:hypothetical protein EVJ22_11465 [Exiguobacterium sp. SH0S7]|uniref:TIGR04104 family putative zinc finger protein n=1 Tax=Exiguobacterium sp. SH0S7 TaxID=2510951 RepID=UPI0010399B63|nr:TIGR04104 family putative zinc finger protein [Exiguobacterium sp. SH0S7]TCI69082.1 hypothetical protein EVJ22_11465 [Exiguobacterium sp. SH0S7]
MVPRCTNCHYEWKIKEVLSLGFSKDGKACPNCGQRQYISNETQKLFTLGYISLLFVPFLFFRIKLSDQNDPFP